MRLMGQIELIGEMHILIRKAHHYYMVSSFAPPHKTTRLITPLSPWRGVGGEADMADEKRESHNAIGLTPFRGLPKMLSLERESHNAIGLTP